MARRLSTWLRWLSLLSRPSCRLQRIDRCGLTTESLSIISEWATVSTLRISIIRFKNTFQFTNYFLNFLFNFYSRNIIFVLENLFSSKFTFLLKKRKNYKKSELFKIILKIIMEEDISIILNIIIIGDPYVGKTNLL